MKNFITAPFLPTDVDVKQISENKAEISAYPFGDGYAITLAHPIRRILMSSSVGYAVIGLKVEGVAHEFDSVRGMFEDISMFIVNLKNMIFKIKDNTLDRIEVSYSFNEKKDIKGSDLENDEIEVVSKDTHLATISDDCNLEFSIIVQRGIGYVASEDIREIIPKDYIALDAFFTPITKVTYDIEKILVEDNPNFEKVTFTIESNGQISPIDAFKEAIKIMHDQMSVFNSVFDLDIKIQEESNETKNEEIDLKELLIKVDSLDLSARSSNSLERAGIKYIGELVLMDESEIKNIKNLGKKSFTEIIEKLDSLGYPMDKELDEEVANALKDKLQQLKA